MLLKVAKHITLSFLCGLYFLASTVFSAPDDLSVLKVDLADIESLDGVFAIAQDKYGFMWFGGKNGLRRYDGYSVEVFKHDPRVEGSLSSNDVSDILVDRQGRLWVALLSGGGLNRFDEKTQRFISYRKDPTDPHSIGSHDIYAMAEDNNGDLWLATHDNGLNRLEHSTGKFYRMPVALPGSSEGAVRDLSIDRLGNVWAATSSLGLFKVNNVQDKFKHYTHEAGDQRSLCSNSLTSIYIDKQDSLWVGTKDCGISRFDPNTGGFESYSLGFKGSSESVGAQVYDIQEDAKARLWVASSAPMLHRFNRYQKQFEPNTLSAKKTRSAVPIRRMFRDRTGSLWLGSDFSKLFLHSDYANQFSVLQKDNTYITSTVNDVVTDSNSIIWVATDRGLLKTQSGVSKSLETVVKNKKINNILMQSDNQLLAESAAGIELFDSHQKQWHSASSELNHILRGEKVWAINETKNGRVWFSTQTKGLVVYNIVSKDIEQFVNDKNDVNSISHNFVWTTFEDSKGNVWVGTLWGLNRYNPTERKWTRFYHEEMNNDSLCDNSVRSVSEDTNGNIWLATHSCLTRYNPSKNIFTSYHIEDGMADDSVTAVYSDSRGYIWATTQKGITRYNPKTDVFKNYDARHGAAANTFPKKARILELGSGEIVISGVFGVSTVDLSTFKDNALVPPVVITDVLVDGQSLNELKPSGAEVAPYLVSEITLARDQKVVSIDFAALNYIFPEQNLYQYKLVGFDSDWSKPSPYQRRATYTNLNPGEYTFLVKGSNNQGLWNETPAQINIRVASSWWSNDWMRFVYIALALFLVWRFSMHIKLVKKTGLKNPIDDTKEQFDRQLLNNLSNEMLPMLDTVSGLAEHMETAMQGEGSEQLRNQAELIRVNSEKLVDLLREINSLTSGGRRDTLNFRDVQLDQILQSIVSWFKPLAEEKGLQLYLTVEGELPGLQADYTSINKVIFTLIANAIKHTDHGYIEVLAKSNGQTIAVDVADTGKGMDERRIEKLFSEPGKTGNKNVFELQVDLAECKRLLSLHNATLTLESKPESGCVFSVSIPV